MPIYADKNLYPGINPHLNSLLQQHGGGWRSFHTAHLGQIFDALDALLPDGYYATPETSLQIGTYDLATDLPLNKPGGTVSDVTIYRRGTSGGQSSALTENSSPTLTLPIPELLFEEDISSVVVYKIEEGNFPGRPITRIELLSPANKAPGSHFSIYRSKRLETLRSGLRLVEIDYLHERRPIDAQIPSYIDWQEGAFPYYIIVSDPRPLDGAGQMDVYGFGILNTIPIVKIPLDGTDTITLDFGSLYNQTFEKRPFRLLTDYEQEPANFASYTENDQKFIKQQMTTFAKRSSSE